MALLPQRQSGLLPQRKTQLLPLDMGASVRAEAEGHQQRFGAPQGGYIPFPTMPTWQQVIQYAKEHPLDALAGVTAPIPLLGDATGLLADSVEMAQNPSATNAMLLGIGAATVAPSGAAGRMAEALFDAGKDAAGTVKRIVGGAGDVAKATRKGGDLTGLPLNPDGTVTLFHSSDNDIVGPFDLSKSGSATDGSFLGTGIYLSDNAFDSSKYGSKTAAYNVDMGNVLDLTRPKREVAQSLPGLKMRDGLTWAEGFKKKDAMRESIQDIMLEPIDGGWVRVQYKANDEWIPIQRRIPEMEVAEDGGVSVALRDMMFKDGMEDPDNIGMIGKYFGADNVRDEAVHRGYDSAVSYGTNLNDKGKEVVVFDPMRIKRQPLPTDQASRMARAKEMGMDTTEKFYHMTLGDLAGGGFDVERFGGSNTGAKDAREGVWMANKPKATDYYAFDPEPITDEYKAYLSNPTKRMLDKSYGKDGLRIDREKKKRTYETFVGSEPKNKIKPEGEYYEGANILPLYTKTKNLLEVAGNVYDERTYMAAIRRAKAEGYSGVRFKGVNDIGEGSIPHDQVIVFDPRDVRSVHANFDPAKKNSADLLAGIAGGLLGLGAYSRLSTEEEY